MKKGTKKVSRSSAAKQPTTNTWMIHEKAIKELEKGMNHLHRQHYADALANFKTIVDTYPQEKELQDRAQVYLRICESRLEKKPGQPKRPEDLFYIGVIKANEADYDQAVDYLGKALQANPQDEKIHYVLASTLALKGSREEALKHLRQAVDLNPMNRIHARNDPDFETIRDDDTAQNILYPEEA